jgi:DNA-binding NtrC family response regulator
VRELETRFERAVVIAPGNEITKEVLRTEISDPKSVVPVITTAPATRLSATSDAV